MMSRREWLREIAPGMVIVLVIGIFWFLGNGVWLRLQIDLEGKVTARQDFPQTRYTHGPTTLYTLLKGDGTIREYTATATDPSLPRTSPIGAYVMKRKEELFYFLNGERIDDFPLIGHIVILCVGLGCMIGAGIRLARDQWYRLLLRSRSAPHSCHLRLSVHASRPRNSGTALSSSDTSSIISVHPRMTASAPLAIKRAMTSL
jgi:hypothetical protein